MEFTATQRTTSNYDKIHPQLQVVGNKIYYVWQERCDYGDNKYSQIWTAVMNIDGTGFVATQRTTSAYHTNETYTLQLQVVSDKIYYVLSKYGDNNRGQIWTAEMNIDGTGFTATQRTNYSGNYNPQMQVVESKIYYVWYRYDDNNKPQIWTAEMNIDGNDFTATQRTTSNYDKIGPQLQVVGNKIYYVWYEFSSYWQIYTAVMNIDGSGFTATQRTPSLYYAEVEPQLQVVGNKIYYVWRDYYPGHPYHQIYTAEMNIDGTGFTATQRTRRDADRYAPQLQVAGGKVNYVWRGKTYNTPSQIWTAEMNIDGNDFTATQRTTSNYDKIGPQLQVVGNKIYYVWQEHDGSHYQIWTAELTIVPPLSRIKYWTGTEWKTGTLKVWDGSNWVVKPVKFWTGTEWKT